MKHLLRDISIQTKLMFSHIILIAIPTIVIMTFFYTQLYDMIVSDSIRQSLALSEQTTATIDATLNQISTIQTAISGSRLAKRVFSGALYQDDTFYLQSDSSSLDDFRILIHSEIDGTFIKAIHIYTDQAPDSFYHTSSLGDIFLPADNSKGTYWHGIFSSSSIYRLYCPSFYLSDAEIKNYGNLAYIEKFFPDNDSENHTPSYLAIYFSSDALTSILQQDSTSDSKSVNYIINERNSIVASSDTGLTGTYFMDYDTVKSLSTSGDGFTVRTVLNTKVYAVSYPISDTDWYMVSILPASEVLRKSHILITSFLILYLLLLAIAFVIAYRLSTSITRRVGIINTQLRNLRKGPPIPIPSPSIHDEIGELADSYNVMTSEMNTLIQHQQKASDQLRISEIRALQAQINPHFLYNTMDMISWLSQTGKNKEVTSAIQALSKFYKLTLNNKDILGTLGTEIEHVSLYMQLQNMRYENKISFLVDIPPELYIYSLPKLTLQPIVENAIQHGILEKPSRSGTIVITAWREKNDLIILVSDDGVGIPEKKCTSILTGKSHNVSGNNIGVHNTHERLHTLYGEPYGLLYRSVLGHGTDVEIRVPIT